METKKKRVLKGTVGIFLILHLISFAVFHFCTYTLGNTAGLYITSYFTEIFESAMPILAVTALYALGVRRLGQSLVYAIPLSAASLIGNFPEYAFRYAEQRLPIGQAFGYSALHSAVLAVINYAAIVLLLLLSAAVTKKRASKIGTQKQNKAEHPFDLNCPASLAAFTASAVIFLYRFVREIITTAAFFIEYGSDFELGEVLYMSARYLYVIALLLLLQLAGFAFGRRTKRKLAELETEAEANDAAVLTSKDESNTETEKT